jgi:hypothetical protein
MWQGCWAGKGGNNCGGDAVIGTFSAAMDYCEQLIWNDYSDWRLPSLDELISIAELRLGVDYRYGHSGEFAIDETVFPSPGYTSWSSTFYTDADCSSYKNYAWSMSFYMGELNAGAPNPWVLDGYICVREINAARTHSSRYYNLTSIADEPIIQDDYTKLAWQGCPAGHFGPTCNLGQITGMSLNDALEYCNNLNWGGRYIWRLPSEKEIMSIHDKKHINPAMDPVFSYPYQNWADFEFWSSTMIFSQFPRLFSFDGGGSMFLIENLSAIYNVRCVRDY